MKDGPTALKIVSSRLDSAHPRRLLRRTALAVGLVALSLSGLSIFVQRLKAIPTTAMALQDVEKEWEISIDSKFDFLGPFPQQAREQYFLGYAFPLQTKSPFELNQSATFPSSLADGGLVRWKQGCVENGSTAFNISYPDVRWSFLRATQGWAGLQHHSILRLTVSISPPEGGVPKEPPIGLLASVVQGSAFALVHRDSPLNLSDVEWYPGNIYDLPSHPHLIPFELAGPMKFDLLISVDYEIRLFGDPQVLSGTDIPAAVVDVDLSLTSERKLSIGSDHFVPDFVGGFALGDALGVDVTVGTEDAVVSDISSAIENLSIRLKGSAFRLKSSQSGRLPVHIQQSGDLSSIKELVIRFTVRYLPSQATEIRSLRLIVRHVPALETLSERDLRLLRPLQQTYWAPHPSASLLLPPFTMTNTSGNYTSPILALHGAGVPLHSSFWTDALPRQRRTWIVVPGGGSAWGYDWRGPSLLDALAAVDALRTHIPNMEQGLVVMGHSNGGQGTLYVASRYPDLVRALIPAAAYQSAALYVPNSYGYGIHFADPALMGILQASLADSDNNLFLGNLVRSHVTLVHGGADTNVPAYHSSSAAQIIKSWDLSAHVRFIEVEAKDHWWNDVFLDPQRADIIARYVASTKPEKPLLDFTLTIMWPQDSGSMGGWRVLDVVVPGRLARLEVRQGCRVVSTNVRRFSLDALDEASSAVNIDGQDFNLPKSLGPISFEQATEGLWQMTVSDLRPTDRGPISRILQSRAPLVIVTGNHQETSSVARRLAWMLHTYLGLASQIIDTDEAIADAGRASLTDPNPEATIVLSGQHGSRYRDLYLQKHRTAVKFGNFGQFELHHYGFKRPGTGIMFMHQHHLFLHGIGVSGLERALRIFPIRTGIPCPEWIVVGEMMDRHGFGGILGVGFWAVDGAWSAISSSIRKELC